MPDNLQYLATSTATSARPPHGTVHAKLSQVKEKGDRVTPLTSQQRIESMASFHAEAAKMSCKDFLRLSPHKLTEMETNVSTSHPRWCLSLTVPCHDTSRMRIVTFALGTYMAVPRMTWRTAY